MSIDNGLYVDGPRIARPAGEFRRYASQGFPLRHTVIQKGK